MSLRDELEEFRQYFLANFPAEKAAIMARADAELNERQVLKHVLKVGDTAPSFSLPSATGQTITLESLLYKGPAVVVFYRGGWCPYCNLELRAYQRLLPEIQKAGGQLVAISLQSPDETLSTQEKNELAFPVLSDTDGKVTQAFGLLFELPDYLQALYTELGHDLPNIQSVGKWALPVPGTFVIAPNGKIVSSYADVNYRVRMEPEEALAAVKAIPITV
ncbi:MAG: AhpC/TSA family protein [Cyanobacteria bacterium]|nr:AhpC/TSA family protein [Cyanobacteriota bacterium]